MIRQWDSFPTFKRDCCEVDASAPEDTMTAEIVIMNKEAVALAADSAVSLVIGPSESPQKIFTSANKIFGLSDNHAVSLMIYNNASFLGVPWEPVFTRFEESLGTVPLLTLADYANRFISFLKSEQELITPEIEKQYFTSLIYTYYLSFRTLFQQQASEMIRDLGVINEDQIGEIVAGKINSFYEQISSTEYVAGADSSIIRALTTVYEEVTKKAIADVFEELPIPDPARVQLQEIPLLFFLKVTGMQDPSSQNFSGIVITGFGKQEIYPSLITYSVDGRLSGILKYAEIENRKITPEYGAYVIPFAQREMVDIFMSGVDSRLVTALVESLAEIFNEYPQAIVDSIETMGEDEKSNLKNQFQPKSDDLVERISTYLDNYRASNSTPILNVVISLPKTELAAMAESLVNLTSLKRKVSLTAETVGGPVDVAVISKRDGFVWIKKKQYFQQELNPQLINHN